MHRKRRNYFVWYWRLIKHRHERRWDAPVSAYYCVLCNRPVLTGVDIIIPPQDIYRIY